MTSQEMSSRKPRAGALGFTLVELLVAMAIFGLISAAGFSLLAQHQPIFNQQQNLAEVNIALRNAVAQMQVDIGNAGANYYTNTNVPNYPVGVVVSNNPVAVGGDCRTGTPKVYGASCFDQMAIISADLSTPPLNPTSSTGACPMKTNSSTTATAYLGPSGSATGYGSGAAGSAAATAAAAHYKYNGGTNPDQLLFVTNDGGHYTTAKLAAATTTGTIGANYYVVVTFGGTDNSAGDPTPGLNSTASNDPYNMSTHDNGMLADQFCNTDWVLRLTPVTYKVDTTTDPNNPTLLRQVATLSQTTAQQALATQIIGFKIGAILFEGGSTDSASYCFDSSQYDSNCLAPGTPPNYQYNYTVVRSVMVSLIGRTNPNPGPAYVFRNTFDGGPYETQGVSVVINPRNMAF
jgi:prepilin-type N-terminal cleavage/methylation domain-containing protein